MNWSTALTRTLRTMCLSGVVAVGLVLASSVRPAVGSVATLPDPSDSPPSAGLAVSPLSVVVGATVTADARFSTPANAIAAAAIRRVRRRNAVASPADGQVTVPGCSATSAGGQHTRMRSRDAIRSSKVRSGRSRAPCHRRARNIDPASSSTHEQRRRAAYTAGKPPRVSTRSTVRPAVPQFA